MNLWQRWLALDKAQQARDRAEARYWLAYAEAGSHEIYKVVKRAAEVMEERKQQRKKKT